MEQPYIFKGLMFDVFSGDKTEDLRKRFPQFKMYPEFVDVQGTDLNSIIRYIVAVYDKKGLRVYEESIQKRKRIASELVGWKEEDRHIRRIYQDILESKNIAVNRMVIRFLKMHKSVRYASLVAKEEAYFTMLERMMGVDDLKKADNELFNALESDIESRITEFLQGDTNKSLTSELIDEIEFEKLELRPEDVAKRIRDGAEVVENFNPYEDWKPSKMRLVVEH